MRADVSLTLGLACSWRGSLTCSRACYIFFFARISLCCILLYHSCARLRYCKPRNLQQQKISHSIRLVHAYAHFLSSLLQNTRRFLVFYMTPPFAKHDFCIREHEHESFGVHIFHTHSLLLQASALKQHEHCEELQTKIVAQVDARKI